LLNHHFDKGINPMRNYLKLAAAAAVLSGGALSQAALADTVLPGTGNGELVLYATYTNTAGAVFSYARGTGVQISAIVGGDKTSLVNDTTYAPLKNLSMSFATLSADGNMGTFLANAAAAGATVSYAVIGGDSTNTPTNRAPGSIRYGITTPTNLSGGLSLVNSNLSGQWASIPTMQNDVNVAIASGATLDKLSTLSGQYGQGAYAAATDTFGTSFVNATALGSSQGFYLLTGGGGLASGTARVYSVGTFTMDTSGNLSFVSAGSTAVPLPAAVWLFGSGLLGLAGVGRRKLAA
jgi:hypothetical protein